MTTHNINKNNLFCDKVWLNPITHKHDNYHLGNMGLEMEVHGYDAKTLAPLGTEGSSLTPQEILKTISKQVKDSTLVQDDATKTITGVKLASGGNFSLEPGGQIEYSTKPTANILDLVKNTHYGFSLLEQASSERVLFLSHGTNPISAPDHPLVVPKERYQFMTRYFQSAPSEIRGIDMMRHSATVQPNLDIFGNSEWHSGVKLILQLVPITNKMFANSKFFHNKKSQFISERQNIWDNMDPTRSGYPTHLSTSEGCPQTECTYAKWAKKAYMLFIDSLDINDQPLYGELTFEQWLQNGYHNVFPNVESWETHLGSLFPHLRLRHFLEIRNIDAQPFEHSFAPLVFYSALLKTKETQQKTWDLLSEFQLNTPEIFSETQDYSPVLEPLLNLACNIHSTHGDNLAIIILQRFMSYLNEREKYWNEPDGLSFTKKNSTLFPSKELIKYLNF